jgi:hypothetical protein
VQSLVAPLPFSKDEPSDNRIRIRRRKVSSPREAGQGPIHVVAVSLNSVAPEDEDGRAISHERAIGTPLENCCQFASINGARVTFKFCLRGRPHFPRRMRYVIFDTLTASLSRITPVVFGDELFQTALWRMCWMADCLRGEPAPLTADLPLILRRFIHSFSFNAVLHRKMYIVFSVHDPSRRCNRTSRDDLGDKDNSSSITPPFSATNVEAKIHFIEIGVKWNCEPSE